MRRVSPLLLACLLTAAVASAQSRQRDGLLSSADACVVLDVAGMGTGAIEVAQAWAGTITFAVSVTGGTYNTLDVAQADTPATFVNTATANGLWSGTVAGYRYLRACMTSYTSGQARVFLSAAAGGGGGGGGGSGGEVTSGVAANFLATATLSATDNAVLDDIADGIPVTNAGTFAAQIDGAALTALQLIDNIVSVEDDPAAANPSGTGISLVRADTPGAVATTNGDIVGQRGTNYGAAFVQVLDSSGNFINTFGGSGGTALADDADFVAGTTSFTPVGGFYQSVVTACTDGDTCTAGITAQRTVKATLFSAAGSELSLASDGTIGTAIGTTGPLGLAVYSEFDGTALPTIALVDNEGENVPIAASIKGVQYIYLVNEDGSQTPLVVEDVAETAANVLVGVGTVRRDTAASSAGTTGDNATLNTDGLGRVWMRDGDPCADPARITHAVISESTAATNEIVALSGSDLIHVCSYKWVTTAANSLNWTRGTGADCVTGPTAIEGAQPYAANGGVTESGGGHSLFVVAAGNALCLVSSVATAHGGRVSYVRTAAP